MANNNYAPDAVSVTLSFSQISQCSDQHSFYGGFQFTETPKKAISREQYVVREKKWLHMTQNWQSYMSKNYKKVRERCRPKAWFYLSGAEILHKSQPKTYEELLKCEGDPHIMDEIKKDQHRQFPLHGPARRS